MLYCLRLRYTSSINVTGVVARNAFVQNHVQPDDCWIKNLNVLLFFVLYAKYMFCLIETYSFFICFAQPCGSREFNY